MNSPKEDDFVRCKFAGDFIREMRLATILAIGFTLIPFQVIYHVNIEPIWWILVISLSVFTSGSIYALAIRRHWPPRALWMISFGVYVELSFLLGNWLLWKAIVLSAIAGILAHIGWLIVWVIFQRRGSNTLNDM